MRFRVNSVKATCAALAWVACACASSEATSELTLLVDADEGVRAALASIDVRAFAADARDSAEPLERLEMHEPAAYPLRLAFRSTFRAPMVIVVRGFSRAGGPVIEQKLETRAVPGQGRRLAVLLGESCLGNDSCEGLSSTCYVYAVEEIAAGACGPVPLGVSQILAPEVGGEPDAALPDDAAVEDGHAGDAHQDDGSAADAAGDATSLPQGWVACGDAGRCHEAYPCLESAGGGYTCAGQFAEWPLSNPYAGGARRPTYEQLADGGVTLDRVTGLAWQRLVPDTYANCTGKVAKLGDRCTWQEAKDYCAALVLDGRTWRLPGRTELLSFLDFTKLKLPTHPYSQDQEAFPVTSDRELVYWSSSPVISLPVESAEPEVPSAWTVSLAGSTGLSYLHETWRVRCVSSHYEGPGTPEDRYQTDQATDTVEDTRTGLVWERAASAQPLSWEAAREHCAARGPGFRVPLISELITTTDPLLEAALPAVFKPSTVGTLLWSADLAITAEPLTLWEAGNSVATLSGTQQSVPGVEARLGIQLGEFLTHVRCVR